MKLNSARKTHRIVASCLVTLIAWAGNGSSQAGGGAVTQNIPRAAGGERLEATDRLIVRYRKDAAAFAYPNLITMAATHAVLNQAGLQARVLRQTPNGAQVLQLDRRMPIALLNGLTVRLLTQDPSIDYAEPDRIMRVQLVPNDPLYTGQWHYYESVGGLNVPGAWNLATGTGVTVGVVDTGYRPHADLAGQIVGGYDMIGDAIVGNAGGGRDADASDPGDAVAAGECGAGEPAESSSWHGTHVSGTIAALTNNAAGVAGIAFGAKVLPVRVLGKCGGYTSDIADGITWASGGLVAGLPTNLTPARVLNLSLGGSGACDNTTQAAINGARSRGTVVVVAAGNSNANAANFSPASCAGVVAVAAVNRSGGRAYYSNYGSIVDVAAPGGDMRSSSADGILSTLNSGASAPGADIYAYYQGTSMATPHVAAVAALMLSKNPALSPDQVESLLKSTARPFPAACSQCGAGIVDAQAAVAAAAAAGTGSTVLNEIESNDTRASAQVISANPAVVKGTLSASDTDYFRVSLVGGKTLTAKLTPPIGVDYDLYLYNSSGSLLASSTAGASQVDTVTYKNTAAASITVYARVYYYGGGSGSYTLSLSQ